MTESQREVAQFIATFTAQHGYAPTYREISAATGRAISAISRDMRRFEAEGYITRAGRQSRTVRLTSDGWAAL